MNLKRDKFIAVLLLGIVALAVWWNPFSDLGPSIPMPLAHSPIKASREVPRKDSEQVEALTPRALTAEEISVRRSSFKLNLAGLYTAQAAFKSDFNRYTTDLQFIGWAPSDSVIDFKLGFLRSAVVSDPAVVDGTSEDPDRRDTDSFLGTASEPGAEAYSYSEGVQELDLDLYARFCKLGCTATATGFELLLVGRFLGLPHEDVWTINHKKEVIHHRDGLTGQDTAPGGD